MDAAAGAAGRGRGKTTVFRKFQKGRVRAGIPLCGNVHCAEVEAHEELEMRRFGVQG